MKLNNENSLWWFLTKSLILDYKFWRVSPWFFHKKAVFLLKKYCLLFLYVFGGQKFSLGESFVNLFGRDVFFDSRFGLAGYQSILSRHQRMLNITRISGVRTVIDVGANVGFFSMLMRERFPEATVYAIEPVQKIFSALEKNFEGDTKTILVNKAISNFCGSSKVVFNEQESAKSFLGNGVEEVEVQTLDNFVDEHGIGSVDILKIDVETFEKHVLEGAENVLGKTHYLLIEVAVEDNTNYSFSELVGLLYSKGRYNYQLRAFRNFADKGEGEMPIVDFLFENIQR